MQHRNWTRWFCLSAVSKFARQVNRIRWSHISNVNSANICHLRLYSATNILASPCSCALFRKLTYRRIVVYSLHYVAQLIAGGRSKKEVEMLYLSYILHWMYRTFSSRHASTWRNCSCDAKRQQEFTKVYFKFFKEFSVGAGKFVSDLSNWI